VKEANKRLAEGLATLGLAFFMGIVAPFVAIIWVGRFVWSNVKDVAIWLALASVYACLVGAWCVGIYLLLDLPLGLTIFGWILLTLYVVLVNSFSNHAYNADATNEPYERSS
jgi:hypothetical protein